MHFISSYTDSVYGCALLYMQDEDFVIGKDDEGSPTDDSGEGESDASQSGEEEEV